MSIEDVLARIAANGGSGSCDAKVVDQCNAVRSGEPGSSILDAKTQIWLREIRASPYFRRAEEALAEICNHGNDQLGALRYFRAALPERAGQLEVLWQRIKSFGMKVLRR